MCLGCGGRGPRKHSRPLALARFRHCGTRFRGQVKHVRYDGSSRGSEIEAGHIMARILLGFHTGIKRI